MALTLAQASTHDQQVWLIVGLVLTFLLNSMLTIVMTTLKTRAEKQDSRETAEDRAKADQLAESIKQLEAEREKTAEARFQAIVAKIDGINDTVQVQLRALRENDIRKEQQLARLDVDVRKILSMQHTAKA